MEALVEMELQRDPAGWGEKDVCGTRACGGQGPLACRALGDPKDL